MMRKASPMVLLVETGRLSGCGYDRLQASDEQVGAARGALGSAVSRRMVVVEKYPAASPTAAAR